MQFWSGIWTFNSFFVSHSSSFCVCAILLPWSPLLSTVRCVSGSHPCSEMRLEWRSQPPLPLHPPTGHNSYLIFWFPFLTCSGAEARTKWSNTKSKCSNCDITHDLEQRSFWASLLEITLLSTTPGSHWKLTTTSRASEVIPGFPCRSFANRWKISNIYFIPLLPGIVHLLLACGTENS